MKFIDIVRDYSPIHMRSFMDDNMHLVQGISNVIEEDKDKRVVPDINLIMSPFHLVSMDKEGLFPNSVKVVFILQDPYYTPGAACGIATASLNGNIQPTLSNIYKRICATYTPIDGNMPILHDGDIRGWCHQGVLLMNAAMTTLENNKIAPHLDVWSLFTQRLIKWMSDTYPFLVFVFLGRKAQLYKRLVNSTRHHIIETSHPSPNGAMYGFNTCNIFNDINEALSLNMREPIKWENYSYV